MHIRQGFASFSATDIDFPNIVYLRKDHFGVVISARMYIRNLAKVELKFSIHPGSIHVSYVGTLASKIQGKLMLSTG